MFLGIPVTPRVDPIQGKEIQFLDEEILSKVIEEAKRKFKKVTGADGRLMLVGELSN